MKLTFLRLAFTCLGLTAVLSLTGLSTVFADDDGCPSRCVRGTVQRVVDGDTVVFRPFNAKKSEPFWKIRMLNIDTPESKMPTGHGGMAMQYPWGPQATCYLQELLNMNPYKDVHSCFKKRGDTKEVSHAYVTLQVAGVDKYGRKLGKLFYHKGDVNLEMVRSGWAIPYFYCKGNRCNRNFVRRELVEAFAKACYDAKTNGRGVFDPDLPLHEMPFEFRVRVQEREFTKYIGDAETGDLYGPTHYDQVHVCKRIFFDSQRAAVRIGFKPVETDGRRRSR